MRSEIISTSTGHHWLDADGIIHAEFFEGSSHTINDARASNHAITTLAGGQKKPLLVDIRELRSITQEARSFYASEESTQNVSALAMLVGSPISRMIGNFFLGINRLPFSVSIFTDEREALSWLRKFLEAENDQS